MVVEALLVISVASLNFAVVPRCPWANCLVRNAKFIAKDIKVMYPLSLRGVVKFASIVSLYCFGSIPKVGNRSLHKINGRIAALLLVGIYETFLVASSIIVYW